MKPLALPQTGRFECEVEARHTVPNVLPGSLLEAGAPVLASATLLAVFEAACWDVLDRYLDQDEVTLGVGFKFRHRGPAWPGEHLLALAEVTDTDPEHRAVGFRCSAWVCGRLVGEMDHEARVVDQVQWMAEMQKRTQMPVL